VQITGYDTDVKRIAKHPDAQRLQTIPGIGLFGAALLLAEIGTIQRFHTAHELAAYAGLVPSTRSSGDKVSRESNHWLKRILIEAVQTLNRCPGPVRFHYERLLRAKGKPKATVAAARKLGTYIYWMWTQELSYAAWLETETKRVGCPMQTLASSA
jgi:transposase